MTCSLVDEAERAATAFETKDLGQRRACLFEEEISRTGRVFLSTADNKCTRGSSRTAGSKSKSRKVNKNAEDLHDGNRGMASVCWF